MIIFSFCIYGIGLKYYLGLVENVIIINKYYPDAHIHIYIGKNHDEEFINKMKDKNYNNVVYIETGIDGAINTYYRYKSIVSLGLGVGGGGGGGGGVGGGVGGGCGGCGCTNNVFISRDTDSCINDRDRWCINDFLNEEYEKYYFQVIRDHYWHKSKLLAGLTCFVDDGSDRFNDMRNEFKKNFDIIEMTIDGGGGYNYGCDEEILNNKIYPIIKDNLIVYTNICAYAGENVRNINYENDNYNFVGNVIEYEYALEGREVKKRYVFKYNDFNLVEHIKWLKNEKQFKLIITTINDCNNIPENKITETLDYKYIAYYYSQQLKECMDIYKDFYKYDISEHIKDNSMYVYTLAKEKGYKIVGTCNVNYEPKIDEIVIYFGNYADDYMALPQSNKIYIHVIYLEKFIKIVDVYVYDECWNDIERIYIMTLENEFERLTETLLQLCLMNAPLNKLYIYRATKDVNIVDIYIGATNNHLHCLYHMLTTATATATAHTPALAPTPAHTTAPINPINPTSNKSCLFLEDDFIFTSVIEDNKKKLKSFCNRKYDYDICFLSASKYHKREDYDDLLILSKQICTTSSGYLINYKNIEKIYNIVKEGNELLKITGDSNSYCIDRYWCKLCNDNKVFIFKNKLGFQKPSQSKITGTYNCNLD
jgi:hypothetical protein